MRAKIIYIIMALLSVVFYILFNNQSVFLFMLILLIMGPLSILINLISSKGVSMEINCEKEEKTGYFVVTITTTNKQILPVFRVKTLFTIRNNLTQVKKENVFEFAVAPKSKTVKKIKFESKYCGRIEFDAEKTYVYDFLGLTRRAIKVKQTKGLYSYPVISEEYYDILDNVSKDELNIQNRYTHMKGNDITQILDIRDYEKGDNIKTVHWKLSGKFRKKMVKELDTPASQDTIVLIALSETASNMPEIIDKLAGTVLSMSRELLEEQIFFDALLIKESSGHSNLYTIQEKNAPDFYEKKFLDGDLCFDKQRLEEYIYYNRILFRYSLVILVTDNKLNGMFHDIGNIFQITV